MSRTFYFIDTVFIAYIMHGITLCYGSAFLYYGEFGRWPSKYSLSTNEIFGDTAHWLAVAEPAENVLFLIVLLVVPYVIIRLLFFLYKVIRHKEKININYSLIALLTFSIFYISDPFGTMNWLIAD